MIYLQLPTPQLGNFILYPNKRICFGLEYTIHIGFYTKDMKPQIDSQLAMPSNPLGEEEPFCFAIMSTPVEMTKEWQPWELVTSVTQRMIRHVFDKLYNQ